MFSADNPGVLTHGYDHYMSIAIFLCGGLYYYGIIVATMCIGVVDEWEWDVVYRSCTQNGCENPIK